MRKPDLSQFPFVKVNQFEKAPFCVDGRAGKVSGKIFGPYPQLLGGSLMVAVLEFLINRPFDNLEDILGKTFEKLKSFGYPLGVHTSVHADEKKSDCGFADNLGKILKTFEEKMPEIRSIIKGLGLGFEEKVWDKIKENLKKVDFKKLPSGRQLILKAEKLGAVKQVLEGEHRETAAIVNFKKEETLDVDNNQNHQAFNLDLWLAEEIANKFEWDLLVVRALSLGLYVATEMVLVEEKGKKRLPILVRR